MKRFFAIVLAVALLATALIGCSKGSSNKSEQESSTLAKEEAKPVSIRFSVGFTEEIPALYKPMMEVLEKFKQENPNIIVDFETVGSAYHDKLSTEIASDTLANVFIHWGGSEMYEAVKSKKVLDLTPYFDADSDFKSQFSKTTLNGSNNSYQDIPGIYGVPFSNVSGAFFYNKELFQKAGVADIPKSWDDLIATIEKLKAIDVIPWVIGAKDGWRVEHLYDAIFFRLNGVETAYKLSDRSIKYTDPAAVQPWEEINKLVDMGAFGPNPASVDFGTEMSLFATGKAAMNFSISGFVMNYEGADSQIKGKVGVFNVPAFKGKEQFAQDNFAGGDMCFAVAANASKEQIDASWKLAKFIGSIESSQLFSNENAVLVANAKIIPDPSKAQPIMTDFADVANKANAVMLSVCTPDKVASLLAKTRDVGAALVNKQLTPKQAGAELDAEIASNERK